MMPRLLAIYLNDHLAGATFGVELARRAARENRGTELGTFLQALSGEIQEDRATLLRLMNRLEVSPSTLKASVGWAAEKLGRLKPNGRLTGYSPLSRLLELEGLSAGIEGKRALWLALAEIGDSDTHLQEFDCPALAERARSQGERLESHRRAAAAEALR
jgi:hypothetical protein